MANQLKLGNIAPFQHVIAENGNEEYTIIVRDSDQVDISDETVLARLHLDNSKYVSSNVPNGEHTFDCEFALLEKIVDNTIKIDSIAKKIFKIEGLEIDGTVGYDQANQVVTAVLGDNKSLKIDFVDPGDYGYVLSSLVNGSLDLLN